MRTRAKLALSGLALLAGLAAAEIAVRALHLAPPPVPGVEGELMARLEGQGLRHENLPLAVQRIRYWTRAGGIAREVVATVNAEGFRGPSLALEKPAGTLRIAVVGDSHVFGAGVSDAEPWPAVLRDELGRALAPRRVEVLNGGVNGYDAEQALLRLEQRILAYSPDLVLYGFFWNDTVLAGLEESVEPLEPSLGMRILDPDRGWIPVRLRRGSKLVEFVADGLFRRLSLREWGRTRGVFFRDDFEGWVRTRAAMRRARDLVLERGGRFAVVPFPLLVRVEGRLVSDAIHATVEGFCASEGIPCLDLAPVFEGLDVDALQVNERDRHAGAQAHRLAGEAVAAWILRAGLDRAAGGR